MVDAVETELMLRSDGLGNGNGGGPTEIPVISEEDETTEAGKEKVPTSSSLLF